MAPQEVTCYVFLAPSLCLGAQLPGSDARGDRAHHVGHARPQAVTLLLGVLHQGLDEGGVGPYGILDVGHHLNAVLANIPISLQRKGS